MSDTPGPPTQAAGQTTHHDAPPSDPSGTASTAGAADSGVGPSGDGCAECLTSNGWWLHLRRCVTCGHVGCCDSSPEQHASHHAHVAGHAVAQSYEPDEEWFWDYAHNHYVDGPQLRPPTSHPRSQPTPGPLGAVPPDWESRLH